MLCKGCQYPQTQVVYTRHDEARNIINRRRVCMKCGLRFTTSEQYKLPRNLNDNRYTDGNK